MWCQCFRLTYLQYIRILKKYIVGIFRGYFVFFFHLVQQFPGFIEKIFHNVFCQVVALIINFT